MFNSTSPDGFTDYDGDDDSDDVNTGSGFSYVALVLGVFAGLFVVFVTLGAIYYRRSKKVAVLEADWKQRQEEKMMEEDNR